MLVDDADLIAWFGTNPRLALIPPEKREEGVKKFMSMPLGKFLQSWEVEKQTFAVTVD
jgi:hypothetical protein